MSEAPERAGATSTVPRVPGDASARARYARSMRRPRLVYAVALAVVVVVFGTIFTLVWANGSAAHATLHTVGSAPRNLPLSTASTTQTRAWSTGERAAAGTPQYRGTVITFSAHTLGGRDARTGARTWSYTRTDRTICYAAQSGGTALAVFRNSGNCDEIDAFDAGTGARSWERTLDQDGQPVDGTPHFQLTDATLLVTTPQVVYAINPQGAPQGGLNRWTYTRFGCRIQHAVLGASGALIQQTCGSQVRCEGVKFCARGRQLLLRDPMASTDDEDKPNSDNIDWLLRGYTGVPATAGSVVGAVQPGSNVLDVLNQDSGRVSGHVQLSPAPSSLSDIVPVATDAGDVVWVDGYSYLVLAATARPTWTLATSGPPTATNTTSSTTAVQNARVTAAISGGVATVDGRSGQVTQRYAVPSPPAGSSVYPLGTGFLVASTSGTTVYR